MMKFRLKFISVLLALVMFLTFVPDTLYAEAADLLSDMMSNESSENVKAENSEETENTSKEVYALGEDVSKRTENAKYIRMSDGSYYVAMYDNAVHYQDENGVWQDIDNTLADSLAADSDDVVGVATSKGKHTVKFANNSNSSKLVAIRQDKYKISFNLVGANKSKAATVTNPTEHAEDATELEKITVLNKMISSVKYADILDGVDLEYVVSGNDVKENIIVKECADKYIYQFDMKLNKLVAEMQADGTIALKDDKSGEVVYTIAMPYMFDANGEHSKEVNYTLEQIKNKEYRIMVTADAEWINADGRAFPVTIDPPINASSDVQNTYVSEDEFDRNLTGYNLYDVGYADGYRLYTFWKSDFLPQIPQGSVIQKATLSFRQGSYYSDAAESYVGLYQVSGNWSESEITWDNMPSIGSALLDYSAVSSSSNHTLTTWNITKAAKKWYYSGSNYGIAVKPLYDDDTVDDFEVGFFSRYVTSYAPTFTVTYRSIVGIEDYYTYHTQSIGRAGIGYLNDYTSNLTLAHSDLSSNSETISFSLSHIYNDAYAGTHFTSSAGINTCDFSAMSMGYGWKLNVQETVISKVIGGETFYILNDADGTEHYFVDKENDDVYVDEDGLGLTLRISGTTCTINDKQDNKKIFSNGKLTQIVDSDGNKILINYNGTRLSNISRQNIGKSAEVIVTFSYVSNRLDAITDAYGRITEFDYDSNNCLIKITYPDGKTSEYTYNANKNYRLTSATDKEANYGVSYTMSSDSSQYGYAWKYIREIREYYLSGTTPNYGQGLYVENIIGMQATYTPFKPSFNLENISTTYNFDNYGRSATVYSSDIEGYIYGASSADYVDSDNVKQNNRIDTSAVVGAISQNCILNGGFENGTSATGWRTYNLSVGNSVAYAHTGTKALISSSTSNLTRHAYQTFRVKNAGQYTASAYVNVSETDFSYGGYIYVKVTDTYGNTVEGTKITNNMTYALDDPWQRIYVTFDAIKDRDYTVYVYMTGISGGYVYIDDVQVERSGGPSAVNLLEGVDTWTLDTGAGYSTVTVDAYISRDAIFLGGGNGTGRNLSARKTININKSGSTTFLVSGWAYLTTTPDASNREISLTAKIIYSNGTTEYVRVDFNPEIYGREQFIQGVIVPEKTNLTISQIQLILTCKNHLGAVNIYDLALVEGVVNDYEYDAEGNVTSSKQSQIDEVETTYDSNDNVTSQKQGNTIYEYTYDDEYTHRVTGVTTPNTFMDFEYDDYGNVVGMTISGGNPISYYSQNTYTSDGNYLASQTDMNRITTSYEYDDHDLISKITNGKGVETTYTYDVNNDRQLSAAVNNLIKVNYTYANAALSKITRNDGQTYSFTYNSFGRTTAVKVGSITLVTYTYEAYNGNLLTTTYNNGVVISNEYDELDRIIAIKINGVTKYKYSYNGNGNLSELRDIDNNITICYNYDINNRLISVWQTDGGDVAYTYYKYDGKNRVSEYNCVMQTWGPEFSHNYTYTYGSQDDQLEEIRVNDDTINYTYDSVDRLTSKSVSATGINLQQLYYYNDGEYMTNQISGLYVKLNNVTSKMFGYTYDAIGNITQITVGGATESTYTYDVQGQLLTETIASQNLKYEYTYDNYGNIQTVTKKNLSTNAVIDTYNYTYGNSQWKDRLTAFNGTGITYDGIGNPLSYFNGSSYTFTWQNGRELASSTKNGYTTTYAYGADGLRISKSSGYEFFYSDGRLVRQLWADGEVLDFLYDESGTPYAMQYYSTMYYYVKNLQGDVVAIADANGTIVVNYAYDAWGNILSVSGSMASTIGAINPIRYRSYYYDTETGFYYLQSRYYDPAIRRFINADGYVNANGDILGFNMYAYCGNNPVMYKDKTGEGVKKFFVKLFLSSAWDFWTYIVSEINYSHNKKNETNANTTTKGQIINDQDGERISNFYFGFASATGTSCEVIAVHNIKIFLGIDSTLSDTIKVFQEERGMILGGFLGSNPFIIGKVLRHSMLNYRNVSLEEMNTQGYYIISFWNNGNITEGLHTVAVYFDGNVYSTYNLYGNGEVYYMNPSEYAYSYICGYYIWR